uniref:SWIM-type domain-containing protein n=1 Tax=Lactuca sativa TaxID=4236 RepID=A0A9R1XGI8_LACSA|nr:hypothetical protein LSAT_V11C400168090 [Lactuca sativa]
MLVLLVNQRNVPILMLIEAICDYIQRIFCLTLTSVLTPYVKIVLQKRMQKFVRWHVTKIPPEILFSLPSDIYRVFNFKTTCIVDLNYHTCSCRKWCNLCITCGHIIAPSPDTVHIYYWTDVFRTTYHTQNVHLLPPPSEWEIQSPLMVVLMSM